MSRIKNTFFALILFSPIILLNCTSEEPLEDIKYNEMKYQLSVNPDKIEKFDYLGGEKTLTIKAEEIVKKFVNDVYQPNSDEIVNADFEYSLEGSDGFTASKENYTIKVEVSKNESEERTAELFVFLKDKPHYNTTIQLVQEASPEFFIYELILSVEDMLIFTSEGGSKNITITANEKHMKKEGDDVVELEVKQTPFKIELTGDVFTKNLVGNTLTLTTPKNDLGYVEHMGELTITLDKDSTKTITLALIQKGVPFPKDHPFPLLAEYNVGPTPKVFTDSHDNDRSGLYIQSDAVNVCPDGWRLPTYEEQSYYSPGNVNDRIGIYGKEVEYKIINKTAYRYRKIGTFTETTPPNNTSRLEITARYLGDVAIQPGLITQKEWWDSNNSGDVVRYFPMPGRLQGGKVNSFGARAFYWSTSKNPSSGNPYHMSINNWDIYENSGYDGSVGGPARCIKIVNN